MTKEGYFGENSKTPSFLHLKKSSFADPTNILKSAEQNASISSTSTNNLQVSPSLISLEKSPKFYHSSKISKTKFSKKKALPVTIVLLLFGAGGFFVMGSNSLLGPHISALTTQNTNLARTANAATEGTLLSWLSKKGLLPKSLQNRFVKNGATSATNSTIEYKGQTLSGDAIKTTIDTDVEFSDVANNATRSNVLDFHDTSANSTYKHLSQSRNIFKDYKTTGDAEADQASYTTLRTEAAGGDSGNVRLNTAEDEVKTDPETGETVTDSDGNPVTERKATGSDLNTKSTDGDTATTKAKTFLSGTAAKVASKVNAACAFWQVGNMVSMAVSAYELYASINYFHNTIESISKTMDGEGTNSGINQTMNFFTKSTTETVTNASTGEEVTVTGAPLQSEWARSNLGNVAPNTNNSSLYGFERLGVASLGVLGTVFTNKKAAATCNVSRAASAAISLASIATGGLIGTFIGALLGTAVKIGITVAISGALSAFIPIVAKSLFTNTYKEYESGIPAGEEFGRGAMASNARINRTASGLTASSKENSLAYQKLHSETVAREAKLDRYRRSPFDATSPNTFLGSILHQFAFAPIFNGSSFFSTITSGNLFSTISTIASATEYSLNRTASAAPVEGNTYLTTYGSCPYQTDINAACEMYDNTLLAADPSTFDITPDDPTYQKVLAPSLETDENGKEKIKDNSPLAQFISLYLDRDSIEGVYDVNIEKACQTSFSVVGQSLPIIGEITDLVNTAEAATCADIATGERYVYSEDNPRWDSEIKYYSAYVRINRILDRYGYFEETGSKNPVVAYREHYAEEHPLDNSRSGTLARISGLSKDDAETVFALVDYYEFLETYSPEDTYAFNPTSSESFPQSINPSVTSVNSDFSTIFSTNENNSTPAILLANFAYDRKKEGITA